MAKVSKEAEVPEFEFQFFKSKTPGEWTSKFIKNGELILETETNSFQYCVAIKERKMSLAIYE